MKTCSTEVWGPAIPKLKSSFCHSLAMWPKESHSTSLSISFSTWLMVVVTRLNTASVIFYTPMLYTLCIHLLFSSAWQTLMYIVISWIVTPQNLYVTVLHPRTSECDLLGNRAIADVISYSEVILEWEGPITQYGWCSYTKGKLGRRDMNTRRMPFKDWHYPIMSQRIPEAGREVWNR